MRHILFFIVLSLSSLSIAQERTDLPITRISETSGLTQLDNHFIYRDSEGLAWLSSVEGLFRYDGSRVRRYHPVPGDSMSMIGLNVQGYFSEDRDQNLWFCTYDAINCYVRKEDAFVSFALPGNNAPGYFSSGLDSNGNLWFLHDTSLYTFHITEQTFTRRADVPYGTSRAELLQNDAGMVTHIVTYTKTRERPGIQVIRRTESNAFESTLHLTKTSPTPVAVRDVCFQHDTILWITARTGLYHFHLKTYQSKHYSPLTENQFVHFNAVETLNDSLLFIASYDLGAFIFHIGQETFQEQFQFVTDDVVLDHSQTLYHDKYGGMWVSFSGNGVGYWHPDNFCFRYYRHTIETSLSAGGINLNRLHELSDQTVFGSMNEQGGVYLHDATTVDRLVNKDMTENWPAFNTTTSLLDVRQRLWIATAEGLVVLDSQGELHAPKPDSIWIKSLCQTADQVLAGGSNGGLYTIDERAENAYSLDKILHIDASKIFTQLYYHPDGRVFGATDLTTIDIYNANDNFRLVGSIPFRCDTRCIVPLEDGSEIWFGTDKGIFTYSTAESRLDTLDWHPDLPGLSVFGIVHAPPWVWVSTNAGILRLDVKNQKVTAFNPSHGTGSTIFNADAFLHRRNGEVWFGSRDGITVIAPDTECRPVISSKVNLISILINDEAPSGLRCQSTHSENISDFRQISLPYTQNTISLEFGALDYTGPDHTTYSYQMTGMDHGWVDSERRNFVRYANLAPGKYTFRVRTGKPYTDNEEIRTLQIAITAPFYRQQWFILLAAISFVSIVFLVYRTYERRRQTVKRLRLEKQIAVETERLRIANDMHDDLGSGLSALNLRTKFITEQVNDPALRGQLDELANITNRMTQQIRETIWTINASHDTIDNLITRLHQYAMEYFESTDIRVRIKLLPKQVTAHIPGNHRRDLYLTFKEALHNVHKHAKATELFIEMQMGKRNVLILTIRDNGTGFDTNTKNSGLGLTSMRNRMEGVGGTFDIISVSHGTTVTLTYPVPDTDDHKI